MSQIIKQIIKRKPAPSQNAQVVCNFSNNYYGDQVCRLVTTQPAQQS